MGVRSWSTNVRRWAAVAVFLAVAGVVGSAAAQNRSDVDSQNFEPAFGPHAIFTVEETGTLRHLEPGGALVFDYLSNPVVAGREGPRQRSIVDQQLAADILGGIGLTEHGQISAHLPVYFVNDVQYGGRDYSGATVGDLRITPKYQIVSRKNAPVGLAASLDFVIPTGNGQAFVGAPTVAAEPKVLVDMVLNKTTLAANLGMQFQGTGRVRNLPVGHRFTYRLGLEQEVVDGLVDVSGELYGYTPLSRFFSDANASPLEGILGAKVRTEPGLIILAGAGGGIAPGLGAPEFRAFVGVSYPRQVTDSDGDGIDDGEDACPQKPEDLDGFEDSDGCPDPDNDGDGIPDAEDECPNEPEDQNGLEDEDGCPDGEQDSDGDGIPDAEDACVDKPEDEDGYKDEDGCPDPDNDGDGIPDGEDECPGEAEDDDGFEDSDGCPDPDNDGDGIPDAEDECPQKPGLEKEDGCPAEKKKAVRKEKEIENLEKVFFEYDKAVLKEKSLDVLDQIGLILRTNPDITKLVIEGHTDDIGSEKYNQQLSEQRAKAVKQYLVDQQDIDAKRLETKGLGASEPLVPNSSKKNRQRNRRVEFVIAEQGKPKSAGESSNAGASKDGGGDSGESTDE